MANMSKDLDGLQKTSLKNSGCVSGYKYTSEKKKQNKTTQEFISKQFVEFWLPFLARMYTTKFTCARTLLTLRRQSF